MRQTLLLHINAAQHSPASRDTLRARCLRRGDIFLADQVEDLPSYPAVRDDH